MCITAPGRVIGLDAEGAIVDLDGMRRRASTLVVGDLVVGDWVIVGAGTILRRLDPDEGLELSKAITEAAASVDVHEAPEGGER